MPNADDQQKLQKAFLLHQKGNLTEAANLYRQLIKKNSNNFHALHFLGVIEAGFGNYEQAKLLMARSLAIQPPNIQFLENYATILFQIGDYKSALQVCQQGLRHNNTNVSLLYVSAISLFKLNQLQESLTQFDKLLLLQPNHIVALNERGSVLAEMKQYDTALASVEKVLTLNPQYAEAHLNKGNLYSELKRYDEAFAAYDKALALKPDLIDAWLGRGNVFRELKRHDEAVAAYEKALTLKPDFANAWLGRGNVFFDLKRYDEAFAAYDKALALDPGLAEAWLGRGNVFRELKRHNEAFDAYDKALSLRPDLADAWLGRGNVYFDIRRHNEAFTAYDKALSLRPDLADAWLGRGNVFFDLKRYDEAFAAFDKALSLRPDLAEAWLGRGNVYVDLKRYEEAFVAYDKALALKPNLTSVEGARIHAKMDICDWSNYDAECSHLISSVRNGNINTAPFAFLSIPSFSDDQLRCAKLWAANKYPPSRTPIWRGERYAHDRIRVAYLSPDFSQHPVSLLAAGMFECHDKSHFDVTAISIGPDDNSEMRKRLKASFERFIDAAKYSDDKIANLINHLEIDILVDLAGYTGNSRTNILAMRAAPIQLNHIGYMGTMGADFIDYLIADPKLIPASHQQHYSEKIVYLPNSFQPNDRERRIADKIFTRAELGLPQEGFIFCCFNNNYKITPDVYDIWMRILKQVDGSVLWLVAEGPIVARNLRSETTARGVNAERLIFAPRMPYPEHLARLRLADLFLDTLPYNAGATASDALWAGLPVLTRVGETLAGRMGGSVLNAIGLSELITTTSQDYETLAIMLATHPDKLTEIKQKLADNRLTTPLFDTKLFTKHIEAAYSAMYERYQAGLTPAHLYVPNSEGA